MKVKPENSGSKESKTISDEQLLTLQNRALDASGLGFVIANLSEPTWPIVSANTAFYRLSKSHPLAETSSLINLLAESEFEEGSLQEIQSAVKSRVNGSAVTKLRKGDDLWGWSKWVISAVENTPYSGSHLVAVIIDITDQKCAEEEFRKVGAELEERVQERTGALERINQDLEGFTYSVSHDLRAPLRAIMGFSKMLVEDHGRAVDHEMRQTLDRINAAAARMATIIEDLLTFSRLGRKEIVKQRLNLSEMAEAIGADLIRRHPNRTTRIEFDSGAEVTGDPTLIRMAMENLLDNAYKFTSKRSDGLVEFRKLSEHSFVVRDNGAGFDPKYEDKLFKPFERLHSASEYPGTGIGLANVRRILERHGGRIWAEAQPGQGASFYFEL